MKIFKLLMLFVVIFSLVGCNEDEMDRRRLRKAQIRYLESACLRLDGDSLAAHLAIQPEPEVKHVHYHHASHPHPRPRFRH